MNRIATRLSSARQDCTLAGLWSDAALRFRDRVAIHASEKQIGYAELDVRARRLARALAHSGLRAGDTCGLHLERSVACVVSMLATTLVGASWLPLDPTYPSSRLRFMIEDCGIDHLVSDGDTADLCSTGRLKVHCAAAAEAWRGSEWAHSTDRQIDESNVAYVMYTSGSTGRPKGICVEHRALVAFLRSMQALLPVNATARVFSITSPGFDISLLEIFLPLISGGSVVLGTQAEAYDGRLLARRLRAEQPTLIQATPTTWRMLLAAGWQGHGGLTVLTGGEAIDSITASELLQRADSVWNMYGPTEATVWATASRLSPADLNEDNMPIGFPLPHVEIHVDTPAHDSPCHAQGELCLLGPGLARGYVNLPTLTAQKFVHLSGGRAYRTGDRVSRRTDGQLVFHSRVDAQIKLDGHRIEPAEVESVLRGHAEVADVAVAVKKFAGEESKLVAYVVPREFDPNHSRRRRLSEHWRMLWTREYEIAAEHTGEPTFNTAGLRSSYDGRSFDTEVLREQIQHTCERIRSFNPKRILDLGCGGGLVLFSLAGQCEHYVAVDFSPKAIDGLRHETNRLGLTNVQLLEQSIRDSANVDEGAFDTVLLNNVIQYLPDIDYLEDVLDNALRALRPGGVVFVGDVRELSSLQAFQASVIQATNHADSDAGKLRAALHRLECRESELVFDPRWFEQFAATRHAVTGVDVAYKVGRFRSEVVDYRYDVVIRKGGKRQVLEPALTCDCATPDASPERLWQQLSSRRFSSVLVTNLINLRRISAFKFLESIGADLVAAVNLDRGANGDPTQMVDKARTLGYRAIVLPDPAGSPAHFAMLLVSEDTSGSLWSHRPRFDDRVFPASLSNALRHGVVTASSDHQSTVSQLRVKAGRELPPPMCPSHYVVLRDLPRTPAYKIDRDSLPTPSSTRPDLVGDLAPPRDSLELQLSSLFARALHLDCVGATDNFFQLGGNSLATVELLVSIEETLHAVIEMHSFMTRPTVEGVAITINKQRQFRPATALVALQVTGTHPPLFLIHGAGGLAFTVFELGLALPSNRSVFALQDPACNPDVAPARDVEAMAKSLIREISDVQASGPFYLCGHSFGGLIAYEMAVQLRKAGHEVAFLAMLDTPAPSPATHKIDFAARCRKTWRDVRFLAQILMQAGPMIWDGCYI